MIILLIVHNRSTLLCVKQTMQILSCFCSILIVFIALKKKAYLSARLLGRVQVTYSSFVSYGTVIDFELLEIMFMLFVMGQI